MTASPNSAQAEFWSSGNGTNWVDLEPQLDSLFANVNAALLEESSPREGFNILDIGCGTGSTTRAFAKIVGETGHVDGMDISTAMIARATAQAPANTSFTLADAQTEPLPNQHYDRVISRFGVMFFADPVAAFQNIRATLKPGGTLTMACWAAFKENPWFTIPRRVATDLLGSPPSMNPRDPGPFAFADPAYPTEILTAAGFANISVKTRELELRLPGDAQTAAHLSAYIGPANSVLRAQGGTAADMATIVETTRERLRAYEKGAAVVVPAKIHFYSAAP